MRYEVAFTYEANKTALEHLLKFFHQDTKQEDLCFALWRPATGQNRFTAIIYEVIQPLSDDRTLHGNVSFSPKYLGRALSEARKQGAGLAFMHSHPSPGWQPLNMNDTVAERDRIAYAAQATTLPLVGLTVGNDGYWSARFWSRGKDGMNLEWCDKVRVPGPNSYELHFNDKLLPPQPRREVLRRTYDSWGTKNQDTISRLHVGIVGLGSVGCIVAEAMARIGVSRITLIDYDRVECHNLDRLLYGTDRDIGEFKVDLSEGKMRQNATAGEIDITPMRMSVREGKAYKHALDCDIIFSCVDRPMARDVLNFIAYAHLIPVFDCGIEVIPDLSRGGMLAAHWRAYTVTPYHQCLRCSGQYDTSMVVMELDGSLVDPSYVKGIPPEKQSGNQNVFPFSLAVGGMSVNQMIRYLVGPSWWPKVSQEHYQLSTGQVEGTNRHCHNNCLFPTRKARGDSVHPHYIHWATKCSD